jgi:hypothetical protein
MSIFSCLLKSESAVQKALANEWASVPVEAQTEILVILQATNILKANLSLNGDEILALITQAVGSKFVDSWTTIVDKVATSIGISIPADVTPVQTVELIARNLAPRNGDNWADTALRIAAYSLTNLIPGGTIVRTIAIPLVQWVYDNIFKPATVINTIPDSVTQAATILNSLAIQTSSDTPAPEDNGSAIN